MIFKDPDEIRIEVTDTLNLTAQKFAKKPEVCTLEEMDENEAKIEINVWTEDLDTLINALIDLKRRLESE